MTKETRRNIPEEKREERTQHDTSADHILDEEPEGSHFNEGIEARRQQGEHNFESDPDAYLGADEGGSEEAVTPVTAPEIVEEQDEDEQDIHEEFKKDMTGG